MLFKSRYVRELEAQIAYLKSEVQAYKEQNSRLVNRLVERATGRPLDQPAPKPADLDRLMGIFEEDEEPAIKDNRGGDVYDSL